MAANTTLAVTISYGRSNGSSLNLRIDGLYLTQSTQTYTNSVPLVAGRDGYIRVFVMANEGKTARPSVQVRFFKGGAVTWCDVDFQARTIRWRGDQDKIGHEQVTPIAKAALAALLKERRRLATIGGSDSWVFPAPGDPSQAISRHLARD